MITERELTIVGAIRKLVDGGVSGNSDGSNIVYYDGQIPPSESAIKTKLAEMQAEYDAQEYARNRQVEYPSVQECVHAMLDNDNNELDTLQAKRTEIKLKYPK